MEHVVGVDTDTGVEDASRLAKEWSMSSDGTVWNFKLREGIPFHTAPDFDGAELTALDVDDYPSGPRVRPLQPAHHLD